MSESKKPTEADILEKRLDAGWEQIHRAEEKGVDTRAWEEFWLRLLRDYADACAMIVGETEATP